jgi:hypothetical protein
MIEATQKDLEASQRSKPGIHKITLIKDLEKQLAM